MDGDRDLHPLVHVCADPTLVTGYKLGNMPDSTTEATIEALLDILGSSFLLAR